MKHIAAAWIEQVLTFDDPQEVQQYLDELDSKKIYTWRSCTYSNRFYNMDAGLLYAALKPPILEKH